MPTIDALQPLKWLPESGGEIRRVRAADTQTFKKGDLCYLSSGLVTRGGNDIDEDAGDVFGMVMDAYKIAATSNKTRTNMLGTSTGTGATAGYTDVEVLVFTEDTLLISSYVDTTYIAGALVGIATTAALPGTAVCANLTSTGCTAGYLDKWFIGDGGSNTPFVIVAIAPHDALGTVGGRLIVKPLSAVVK